jgi:hypothetical protein
MRIGLNIVRLGELKGDLLALGGRVNDRIYISLEQDNAKTAK